MGFRSIYLVLIILSFNFIISKLSKSFPQIKSKPFYLSFATKLKKDITLIKANKQDYFEAKRVQITNFLDVYDFSSYIFIHKIKLKGDLQDK